jgi:hypothetical protein
MRKIYTLAFGLLITMMFSSCEKLTEQRFSTSFSYDFVVDMQNAEQPYSIDITSVLDVLQKNPELAQHADHIKKFELVQVKYKVYEYFDSPTNLFSGYIGMGSTNTNSADVRQDIIDFSLQSSMLATEHERISFSADDVKKINDYFMQTKSLKLFLNGVTTETPARFKLNVIVDVDAIAEIKVKR